MTNMEAANFKNHFMIAMPGSVAGDFAASVSLIAEHSDEGAMGLVVNKPLDLAVADMLGQLDIEAHVARNMPVYWGGPVQSDRGFVLHRDEGDWESTLNLGHDMAITTSRDILEAIGNGFGPSDFMILLGYAGWGAGQLEKEMLGNSWLSTPADPRVVFDSTCEQRWADAAGLLGIAAHQLTGQAGHA